MSDDVLTKTFEFVRFPKPTPKKKKTMWDYRDSGMNKNVIRRHKKLTTMPKVAKIKRKRLPTLSALKKRADLAFSNFIRNRDKWTCVLCHQKTNIQCGHLLKRGKMSTRYDEINCHALCSGCNYKDNFEPQHYMTWLIEKYGYPTFKKLVDKSKVVKQMKRQDYLDLIKKYERSNIKP